MGLWNYLFGEKEVETLVLTGSGLMNKQEFDKLGVNKELYGTENPVFTNPPAKELALANRIKKREEKSKVEYNKLISSINLAIENGQLVTICWGCQQRWSNRVTKYKYLTQEVDLYLAARELRKAGFKVKLKTQTNPAYEGENNYQPRPITFNSYVKISWK